MTTTAPAILVVGAGFAGAVHARTLAEAGHDVFVIDKRDHIAGNAYDEVAGTGVRIHRYGLHLFHTANREVLAWIHRFGEWLPYTHRVRARLPSGARVPMPINVETVNTVFGTRYRTAEAAQSHLDRIAVPNATPANAAEALAAQIGTELRDLLFRPYTRKMWDRDLEELSAKIVMRLPLRVRDCDTYFKTDETQLLPKDGYTALIGQVLAHPRIRVQLGTAFDKAMLGDAGHCFASLAIDEYFGGCFGPLPYRSLRFSHRDVPRHDPGEAWAGDDTFSIVNFTDDGPFTRETAWHRLPGHVVAPTDETTLTRETPCNDFDNDMERYYPVLTADGAIAARYAAYAALAAREPKTTFIGRCGTYRYLDMDQVISQSLASARRWLARSAG